MKVKSRPNRSARTRRKPASPPADAIRILVADDQAMDRRGMVTMLNEEQDFEVVAEAGTFEEVSRGCRKHAPSLIVLALHLPGPPGSTALAAIRSSTSKTPILAVAERGEGHCMVLNPPGKGRPTPVREGPNCTAGTDCLQLAVMDGATGTIRRSAQPDEFFRAIRTVASGRAWYESGTASAIMHHALANQGRLRRADLSDRETQVAEQIAEGRSNKEIAQTLGISEPTVKKHVGHILRKLRLQDRLQVGLYVARNPLILRVHSGGRR